MSDYTIPLQLRLKYYIAECPECGQRYIWANRHLDMITTTCLCGFKSETSDWPYEELGNLTITVTDDGVQLCED